LPFLGTALWGDSGWLPWVKGKGRGWGGRGRGKGKGLGRTSMRRAHRAYACCRHINFGQKVRSIVGQETK